MSSHDDITTAGGESRPRFGYNDNGQRVMNSPEFSGRGSVKWRQIIMEPGRRTTSDARLLLIEYNARMAGESGNWAVPAKPSVYAEFLRLLARQEWSRLDRTITERVEDAQHLAAALNRALEGGANR